MIVYCRQCLHYENLPYVDVHKAFRESIKTLQGKQLLYKKNIPFSILSKSAYCSLQLDILPPSIISELDILPQFLFFKSFWYRRVSMHA